MELRDIEGWYTDMLRQSRAEIVDFTTNENFDGYVL
jgi:hypothetical protein